jgi:hypothetical protein
MNKEKNMKMTKEIKRAVFTGAIMQLYGDRFKEEADIFRRDAEACVERLARRKAKEHGVEYDALVTTYRMYTHTTDYVRFCCLDVRFYKQIKQAVFNETRDILTFEGARLPVEPRVYDYRDGIRTDLKYIFPNLGAEFDPEGQEEIIAIYKRYGGFMNEVIASACLVRDVINSVSTVKQLEETSPDLAAFIPAQTVCTALVPVETIENVKALFAGK